MAETTGNGTNGVAPSPSAAAEAEEQAKKKRKIAATGDEYLSQRLVLLEKEKELTKLRDEVTKLRQTLPWVEVTKEYEFDAPGNKKTGLSDLFQGKSQLIVQHFMFGPEWENGCKSCSFMADHINGAIKHLLAKDVAYAAIARAPLEKLHVFKDRLGWTDIPFYSSQNSDFNFDYGVSFQEKDKEKGSIHYNFKDRSFFSSEMPGISVFAKDDEKGVIYHTYSTFMRGLDPFITTYQLLDLVPKGRDEDENENYKMGWVRHNDAY